MSKDRTSDMSKIAIIGSGLIGRSWAMVFSAANKTVVLYDIDDGLITAALNNIQTKLTHLQETGDLRGSLSASEQFDLITGTSDLSECLRGANYVQECVPEHLELKKRVLHDVDNLLEEKTILASSTSCLLPSALSTELKHRENFLVAHPINPPYYLTLVEVVPAPWTLASVLEQTRCLMEEIGQSPVTLQREIPGFALNRMQYALLNECWHLIKDGILSAIEVDQVMKCGLGPRYAIIGPIETMCLNADGVVDYCEKYADGAYAVSQTLKPPIQYDVETAKQIQDSYKDTLPLEKLSEKRQWRDEQLAALCKLKKD